MLSSLLKPDCSPRAVHQTTNRNGQGIRNPIRGRVFGDEAHPPSAQTRGPPTGGFYSLEALSEPLPSSVWELSQKAGLPAVRARGLATHAPDRGFERLGVEGHLRSRLALGVPLSIPLEVGLWVGLVTWGSTEHGVPSRCVRL